MKTRMSMPITAPLNQGSVCSCVWADPEARPRYAAPYPPLHQASPQATPSPLHLNTMHGEEDLQKQAGPQVSDCGSQLAAAVALEST